VTCLNPPAAPYQQNGRITNDVHLTSTIDFDSPIRSIHYNEGFNYYRDVPADPKLSILIDVRSVQFNKNQAKIMEAGWTVLPIFFVKELLLNQVYVRSGSYQLPVFKGPVPVNVIQMMATYEDPWMFIEEQLKNSKSPVKYLEGMSVIVRLVDSQREGHFLQPYDFTKFSYDYLPQKGAEKYVYNSAVDQKAQMTNKARALIPKNDDEFNFQRKVSQAVIEKFGLSEGISA